jgi:hypothetical protein
MRFHLLTVEGAQQFGETWRIAPAVPLRILMERGPTLMMPMAGEEIELRLPDGQLLTALIASFGVDAWKDSEGNLFINTDPSDPSLTLTITCNSDVGEVPPGTEVWLSNARSSSASEAS